ncbi:cleavage stimulation factor 64-kDa subunit [Gaeumannomyces tritici R3-111a-1]|uniref:Cleavage stimulation factor 64-kDa subunit n=1 Tax=Gaeumannomyces tritici (strain R3-111a-1) TaxID=644352 RepID=J3NXP9_GAET3|nr:cleavage stimulation factor 64-kDa subunit [Gaeumannomyces tritici R3-111a-1]EJT76131.1 cleavage stimulation factor 64-kDa subunit [Gaeumannomyces tritici R3-111a-1]
MSSRPPSRVVFVGNIPYGLSEEQITDIFSRAGKVINFRLVYDRETGKPKGFGFAEYPDADSAASAVRNLNDSEIMGRKLRVDFSNEGPGGGDKDDGPSNFDHGGGGNNGNGNGPNPNGGNNNNNNIGGNPGLPPLPPGKDLPAGVSATDAISRTLRTLPPAQLLDILGQMKTMAAADPARATELLSQAPQLSYAIFQALLLMDLVSPDAIQSVVEPGVPIPTQPQPPQQFPPANNGTPPVAAPYAPPVVPIQQQPPPAAAPMSADTDTLMQQVLALPQSTIDQLPEAERAQIMQLRANFLGQAR